MKILKVEKIVKEKDGVLIEVTLDDDGVVETQAFGGEEWLEEVDGVPRFLTRVVENLPNLRKARCEKEQKAQKSELKKFKDMEVEV